ncbi:MAG: hypothetical protein V1824_02875 [archaeon]
MNKIYPKRFIGALIIIIAICVMVLALADVSNSIDNTNEYNNCIEIAKYTPDVLNSCRDNASKALGFTIRIDQVKLTISQLLKVYLWGIVKILISIVILVIGLALYYTRIELSHKDKEELIKQKPKIKKKIRR